MIVPMKKVSLLVMDKDRVAALEQLREMGVMHLEKKTAASPVLTELLNRRNQIEIAEGVLTAFTPKKAPETKDVSFKGDLVSHVVALSERRKKLQDYMFSCQREKSNFEKWGEFDPADFNYLCENGVNAYLYELTFESFEKNTADVPLIVLDKDIKNKTVRFIAFKEVPNETPFPLPERPLHVVNERNLHRKTEFAEIESQLTSLSALKKELNEIKNANLADIEFETARAGMELINDDAQTTETAGNMNVSWISGYVPASDLGLLKRAASENGWALCASDPAEDDEEVPTKLKNNKLVSLIYPLTNFLEISPGYRETDISGWFLLFFTLFFGMIFGDAGYGAILLVISFICIAKTAKKGVPVVFKFLLLMSISNFCWGLLSCAWFGMDVAKIPPILQNLSLPLIVNVSENAQWLASYNAGNFWIQSGLISSYESIEGMKKSITVNMMLFCFTIALFQLGIAHIRSLFRLIRSPKALAELGQLGMLIGMYFIVLSLVVFNTGFAGVQTWQLYTLLGGFILVFIFGNYEGNLVKSLLSSCANILTNVLGIANVFSDIMSYIRLWAVGLAGASIASTIDGFVSPMVSSFVFFAFGVILFVFGHGFNMVLNVLSVVVHGVRLNTLEFSSHAGLGWSGFAYKPFAKR